MKKIYQRPSAEKVNVNLFGSLLEAEYKYNVYNGTIWTNTMNTFAKDHQFWDDEDDEPVQAKPSHTNIWYDEEEDEDLR